LKQFITGTILSGVLAFSAFAQDLPKASAERMQSRIEANSGRTMMAVLIGLPILTLISLAANTLWT